MDYTNEWIVVLVNVTHNHALVTPSKHRYLRTNREIPTRERDFQSDFHNMHRDRRVIVLQQDMDLVMDKFEANKN